MTIEALLSDRNLKLPEPHAVATASTPSSTSASSVAASTAAPATAPGSATAKSAADGAVVPVNSDEVHAAVQQLQTAINNGPNPDFKLDYLSGLSVVTVRSTITGQVVYQLPDTQALQLARMIRSGNSSGSLSLFSTTA